MLSYFFSRRIEYASIFWLESVDFISYPWLLNIFNCFKIISLSYMIFLSEARLFKSMVSDLLFPCEIISDPKFLVIIITLLSSSSLMCFPLKEGKVKIATQTKAMVKIVFFHVVVL